MNTTVMKIHPFQFSLAAIALYLVSWTLETAFHISWPLAITGVFLLLLVTPLAILQAFPNEKLSPLDHYFAALILYFFLLVPIGFFLNTWLGIAISLPNILLANLLIIGLVYGIKGIRKEKIASFSFQPNTVYPALKSNFPAVGTILVYCLLHAVNYHFYVFIPEWDSYSDLASIAHVIESGTITQTYRGFFGASVAFLSVFAKLSPYQVFSILFILLQTSLILVLSRLFSIYKIFDRLTQFTLLLTTLAIPVLTMEIDSTRPQNVFLLALPILLVFIYKAVQGHSRLFAILSGLILIFGLNYHEFFLFPALISCGIVGLYLFKKFFVRAKEPLQRIIFIQAGIIVALVFVLISGKINFFQYAVQVILRIVHQITQVSDWRWWFIDHYSSGDSDSPVGWSGLFGAAQYYGYYLSPIGLLFFVLLLWAIKRKSFRQDLFVRIVAPLFLLFFTFAEILPRLNYTYLPERLWVLIDMLLLLLAPALVHHLKLTPGWRKIVLSASLVAILIGLGGTLYVAHSKKALTSEKEYRAALWIRTHTPQDASFISQPANGPMIQYFAGRQIAIADPAFFLSSIVPDDSTPDQIATLQTILDQKTSLINSITSDFATNKTSFPALVNVVQSEKNSIQQIKNQIESDQKTLQQPRYIVYSYDKFNTLYNERAWWRQTNAYGANIEKFNIAFPLVYSDGVIYIWKIR